MTSLDFNRVVGEAKYVRVQPDDVFVFARRPGNKWQTRFVVDRKVEPTRFVTVVLAPNSPGRSGTYLLIASYFGFLSQPEVEDEEAFQWYENPAGAKIEAAAYWAMHAHVLGADDIMCPTCGEKKIRDDEVKGLCREGVVKCVNCWKRK